MCGADTMNPAVRNDIPYALVEIEQDDLCYHFRESDFQRIADASGHHKGQYDSVQCSQGSPGHAFYETSRM